MSSVSTSCPAAASRTTLPRLCPCRSSQRARGQSPWCRHRSRLRASGNLSRSRCHVGDNTATSCRSGPLDWSAGLGCVAFGVDLVGIGVGDDLDAGPTGLGDVASVSFSSGSASVTILTRGRPGSAMLPPVSFSSGPASVRIRMRGRPGWRCCPRCRPRSSRVRRCRSWHSPSLLAGCPGLVDVSPLCASRSSGSVPRMTQLTCGCALMHSARYR